MGLLDRIKAALSFSPAKLTGAPIVNERPLWQQFQRIGGGITPGEVTQILRAADLGQPSRLIDLANESRQRDGHLQSVLAIREDAVALCKLNAVLPDKPKKKERKAVDLCNRAVDEFENWPELIKHLTASVLTGHATAEIRWEKTADGFILPRRAVPVPQRDFIFSQRDGSLRYARFAGDVEGTDLLADNPGRIVQVIRRINGDVLAREGLIRVLVWAALFRNWSLRDWIALGEIGWKPWRIATYDPQKLSDDDLDKLADMLERIGSQGVGCFPSGVDLKIEWPTGSAPGLGGSSSHQAMLEWIGREISKAVLGQTTSTEPGMNGDRAATETRDKIRGEVREGDAIAIAAALRAHMFAPLVAVNIGSGTRVPLMMFDTTNAANVLEFSKAVQALAAAKVRIPAQWVRDEIGAPEPKDDEEVIGAAEPHEDDTDPNDGGDAPDPADAQDDESETDSEEAAAKAA